MKSFSVLPLLAANVAGLTIVETAAATAEFSDLVAVLSDTSFPGYKATLDVLNDATGGPYTVFTPDNAAFATTLAALGSATAYQTTDLTSIIQYHATAAGKVMSADIADGVNFVESLITSPIKVTKSASGIMINEAMVNTGTSPKLFDVDTDNGVVHRIDKVIMPPTDLTSTVATNAGLLKLAEALTANDLVATVDDVTKPYTIFAPADSAFEGAGVDTTSDQLSSVLLDHVVGGYAGSGALADGLELTSAGGSKLMVTLMGGSFYINGSKISSTVDVMTANAVVHVIEGVIGVPPMDPPTEAMAPTETSGASCLYGPLSLVSLLAASVTLF